jgi:hypothetical protein
MNAAPLPSPPAAADALLRAAALIRPMDADLATWIGQAGRRLASGVDPARSLQMDKRTLGKVRLAERDALLREAYRLMPDGEGPWTRAKSLEAHCRKFESDILPSWQRQGGPPPGPSRLRSLLWQAHRLGKFPEAKRLSEICRGC